MTLKDKQCLIKTHDISKNIFNYSEEIKLFKNINFEIYDGDTISIEGSSGAGKTTLLKIISGIEKPTDGDVFIFGQNIHTISEKKLSTIRRKFFSFIFQDFLLIPTLNAIENLYVPLFINNINNYKKQALKALEQVGLSHRSYHYPKQLSGGEQQRLSIARSFMNQPKIIFADEPTGNLDKKNSENITRLLFDMCETYNTSLVIVTHDKSLSSLCNRQFLLDQFTLKPRF